MIKKRLFKKTFIVLLFVMTLLSLFSFSFVSAGSLGMSPSYFKFNFKPYLEETVIINVADSDLNQPIKIYLAGDLTEYVKLNAESFIGAGVLEVKIKLPQALSKPGNHRILVGSVEDKESLGIGKIGGASAIQVPIDIFVPYPGKYAEAEFNVGDVNEGEDIPYNLVISNLGTQSINFSYTLSIIEESSLMPIILPLYSTGFLEPNKKLTLEEKINNSGIKPGYYRGFVDIDYGEKISLNDRFGVGTFFMNITDYDYQFIAGKINKFSVSVKSLWNSLLPSVFLEFSATENGTVKSYFKTENYVFNPWEEKNMTGFIDATNMSAGRYITNIILHYEGKSTNKLVAVYLVEPERSLMEILLYVAGGVIAIFLIITILLVIKIMLLKKHGKNKKKKLEK